MTPIWGLNSSELQPSTGQVVEFILRHVQLMMEALAVRLRDYPRLALPVLRYLYHSLDHLLRGIASVPSPCSPPPVPSHASASLGAS